MPVAGTVLGAGNQTLSVTLTPTDTTDYTTATTTTILAVTQGTTSGSQVTFVSSDTTTEGNWIGTYGADGYSLAGAAQSLPAYASVAIQNATAYTWVGSTSDPRALLKGTGLGGIAGTWFNSPSFSLDVNFTDGNPHQFALYALDWDNRGRAETIQVLDAATKSTLDVRNITKFSSGAYLVWNISGHVTITVTATSGPNAVISGIFCGGGNGNGGGSGTSETVAVSPQSVTLVAGQNQQFTANVNSAPATQTVTWSVDSVAPQNAASGSFSTTIPGLYQPPGAITASTQVTIKATAADGQASGTATVTLSPVTVSSTASYLAMDSATQGNWKNKYGADGYSIAGDKQSLASYDPTFFQNGTSYTWNPTTSDPRALQKASGSGALAATWYGNRTLALNVNCTDTNSHQLALYALDWDNGGRSETIQITDTNTQTVLDTRTISNFGGGVYLLWNISGQVTVTVTLTKGANAVISGVFWGGATSNGSGGSGTNPTTPTITWPAPASVTYGTALSGTQLNASSSVAGTFSYTPVVGTVLTAGSQTLSVTFTPTDTTDYTTATATVPLIVNQVKTSITWSTPAPITYGTALSGTQLNASSSVAGTFSYMPVAGTVLGAGNQTLSVTLTPTDTTDYTTATTTTILAVTQGTTSGSQVTFVSSDTTTEGNWIGTYGADGYSLAGAAQSLPAYASVAIQNATAYTWVGSTSDPRALLKGTGLGGIAGTWFSSPSFSLDVNFTDGNPHQFALYALDWDNRGRAETIQVLDAATKSTLDIRNITKFSSGTYLVWNISGHVTITVTATSGPNAVISGFSSVGAIMD